MNDKVLKERALSLLTRREHSKRELIQKLKARGFDEGVDTLVETLSSKKLQSDERFAESLARSKIAKGYGPLYIEEALKAKGVENSLIDQTLRSLSWEPILEKYYQKIKIKYDLNHQSEQLKLKRALQQRGFLFDQIKKLNLKE